MTGPSEEWRAVVGHEGFYEVSDHGRVRSLPHTSRTRDGRRWQTEGQMLRAGVNGGYPRVTLKAGGRRDVAVHILVMEAFVGPRPPGHEAAHWDGDPSNASLVNLRWATHAENERDKVRHGTRLRGADAPSAKLAEADVVELRRLGHEGWTEGQLATRFDISPAQVANICKGRQWRHVADPHGHIREPRRNGRHRRLLTDEQVRSARRRIADGEQIKLVAQDLGVSQATLWKANSRRTYKDVS